MSATLPPLALSRRARRSARAALSALTLGLAGALVAVPAGAEPVEPAQPGVHDVTDERALAGASTSVPYVSITGSWHENSHGGDQTFLLSPDQRATDPDGDGVYTWTTTQIPSGVWQATWTLGTRWGEGGFLEPWKPGDAPLEGNTVFSTVEGFPVTFSVDPVSGEYSVEASVPGDVDVAAERAFWVDGSTLAFPKDLPVTPDGSVRAVAGDTFSLFTSTQFFAHGWDWPTNPAGVMLQADGERPPRTDLTVGEFSAAQIAQRPELTGHWALTLPPGVEAGDLASEYQVVTRSEFGELWEGYPNMVQDLTWQAIVGVGGSPEEAPARVSIEGHAGTLPAVPAGTEVISGDWDGDGVDTLAWREGNLWTFASANSADATLTTTWYGRADDEALVGDWNGDGKDTIGIRRGNGFHLADHIDSGRADHFFWYGRAEDEVLIGDWDADGRDTVAVRRDNAFHLRNTLTTGSATQGLWYGRPGEPVLAGDIDGNGRDDLVIRRGSDFHVLTTLRTGNASRVLSYDAGPVVLVGDWDGDGKDTFGTVR